MPLVSSELTTFFQSLHTETALRQLVAEREQENIHLEFKRKKRENGPDLDEGDATPQSTS